MFNHLFISIFSIRIIQYRLNVDHTELRNCMQSEPDLIMSISNLVIRVTTSHGPIQLQLY